MKNGFTLIELLIVVAIMGILASVILVSLNSAKKKAYVARSLQEFTSFRQALELYAADHQGNYPPDASRDIPAGLGVYLAGEGANWPKAPWPGSVYDWDNWDDPDNLGQKIYQISVRFCAAGGDLSTCSFPNEPWAQGFGVDSAYYYCVSGMCRSHASEPYNYPGYCVNCSVQPSSL